ncbi:MAG: SusC/RagA family TonB-linked outer membrane protein, partial [Bacteroides acidifaciens]|nr:SusC/RagA family TonB-linked outer membrane protein [Bacteroides acidifaciens]
MKDNKGEPLIGVSVLVKGTTNGTVTNLDGKFSLKVSAGDVLEFSYIGYAAQSVTIANANPLNIVLEEDTEVLDEVVVTALGIKRSEKALTYNVQQVKGDELTAVKSSNFMSSLAGKAAGVQINNSSSGPGSGVKVVMRGAKSISQNNNALYVIDGIPMYNVNTSSSGDSMNSRGSTESIADINPDDIESMSLLTGPSAAALYGYEGANGVVLITTKKGRSGKTSLSYSLSATFSNPLMMPEFQNRYGNVVGESDSWGNPTDYRYDPSGFFNTGTNITNSVALSTGNDKSQSYFSVAATNATGILPNNDYDRYNFTFRNTANFLNDKFILDTSANYIIQNDKNMISQGSYMSPFPALYLFPRGESFDDVATYEHFDPLTGATTQFWPYGQMGLDQQNPYWTMNRMNRETERRRYKLAASLQNKIMEGLNVQGRVSIDNTENIFTEKFHAGTLATFSGPKGHYKEDIRFDRQTYADVMANFNKTFGDFNIVANLGASIKDTRMKSSVITGNLELVTNHFTIENLSRTNNYKVEANGLKRQTQSIFANAEIGWRSFLYSSLTGRSDWDSAFAFSDRGTKAFFYPSIGLSGILSEVIKLPDWFTFLKARVSYTSVGNSYDPYMTKVRYEYDPQNHAYKVMSHYPNSDLKPEKTNSFEAGLNMRFLDNSLNLDITYYTSDTKNQTFYAPLPASSGFKDVA